MDPGVRGTQINVSLFMTPTKKVLEEEKYMNFGFQFPPAGGSTVFVL